MADAGWSGVAGATTLTALTDADGAVEAGASRARNAPNSAMVDISGTGNTTVEFLSAPISTRL